ncbi:MAG TPA: CotH kinase family protein, partial [Myxococcota bacterium]
AFSLSNAAGRWAPYTRYAEVFLVNNGGDVSMASYIGIYEITEKIKRGAARVPDAHLHPSDDDEPAITGGYIFKEDRPGDGNDTFPTPPGLSFEQAFVFDDPDADVLTQAQRDYLTGYTNDVASALLAPDHLSPSGVPYDQLIDVNAFIDHHIINLFTKNPDALRLSGFYFKDRDGPLVAGPVWDFDRTMGCDSDGRAGDPEWWDATNVTSDTTDMFHFGFYGPLFDDPAFASAYFARLGELLQGPLSADSIAVVIDASADQLDEAAARNAARWPEVAPVGGFRAEVDKLRQWTADRNAWMTSCLALPDPRTCTGD